MYFRLLFSLIHLPSRWSMTLMLPYSSAAWRSSSSGRMPAAPCRTVEHALRCRAMFGYVGMRLMEAPGIHLSVWHTGLKIVCSCCAMPVAETVDGDAMRLTEPCAMDGRRASVWASLLITLAVAYLQLPESASAEDVSCILDE